MQLIKLSANKESFRTVNFELNKPNYIIGKSTIKTESNTKKTYNGVGKSLVVFLIHFCLGGSSAINQMQEHLDDWEFYLDFVHNGITYEVVRTVENHEKIILNEEEYSIAKFKEYMFDLLFSSEKVEKYISFRNTMKRFIRPTKLSYHAYNVYEKGEEKKEYQRSLVNAFLLGLDIDLMQEKHNLVVEQKAVKKKKTNFKKDDIISKYFDSDEDVEIDILDLKEEIAELDSRIKNYKVAENYDQVKSQLANLKQQRIQNSNDINLIQNNLTNIKGSLGNSPDISASEISEIYKSISISLPEHIQKELNQVEEFYKNLSAERKKRLRKSKVEFEKKIEKLESKRKSLQAEIDEITKYLGEHGAFEEYQTINEMRSTKNARLEKIQTYKEINNQYESRITEIENELSDLNLKAVKYLQDWKETMLTPVNKTVRDLSKLFYEDKPGGIEVNYDRGDNQNSFTIKMHMGSDTSDGIGEVKIFCYDLTMLQLHRNHKIDFIFHDSRLFANMDPRQIYTLFKIVNEVAPTKGIQYIATINQSQVESFRKHTTPEEFVEIVDSNIILELSDDSESSKLLGVNLPDFKYEED